MGTQLAARNQEPNRMSDYKKDGRDTTGEDTSQDSSLRIRLDTALHDLENAQANLDLEKQRVSFLVTFFLVRQLSGIFLFLTTPLLFLLGRNWCRRML